MSESNEEFVHRHNVINFLRQIAAAQDDARRKQLMALLAEERRKAKLNGWSPIIG
jgi:hypothetical protein